ncbi:hypothetical protein QQF64_025550 [Cirrhinus molitorella]|uniref:Uncharacterized protein n=1 Tax=Cirrhinus molitorella TaxID=172907 RepID=A0ABR3NQ79_9TELE
MVAAHRLRSRSRSARQWSGTRYETSSRLCAVILSVFMKRPYSVCVYEFIERSYAVCECLLKTHTPRVWLSAAVCFGSGSETVAALLGTAAQMFLAMLE